MIVSVANYRASDASMQRREDLFRATIENLKKRQILAPIPGSSASVEQIMYLAVVDATKSKKPVKMPRGPIMVQVYNLITKPNPNVRKAKIPSPAKGVETRGRSRIKTLGRGFEIGAGFEDDHIQQASRVAHDPSAGQYLYAFKLV